MKKLQKLLEQEKDFDLNVFFEKFCAQFKITPFESWDTTTQSFAGSDKFDEVLLNATFKQLTTQQLVTILEELNKNELVYIKELNITNEETKTITVNIIIATKKFKLNG